jgi:CheY-like chemotaxis protein
MNCRLLKAMAVIMVTSEEAAQFEYVGAEYVEPNNEDDEPTEKISGPIVATVVDGLHAAAGCVDIESFRLMIAYAAEEIRRTVDGKAVKARPESLVTILDQFTGVEIRSDHTHLGKVHKSRLSLVLGNLINNARAVLKQNEINDGRISLETRLEGDKIQIIVRDNAGGIPEDMLGTIWTERKSKTGSTGTGLAYCKKTLEPWGAIEAKNENWEGGRGACFVITVDAQTGPDFSFLSETRNGLNVAEAIRGGKKGYIPVIDDHKVNQIVLRRILEGLVEDMDLSGIIEIIVCENAADAAIKILAASKENDCTPLAIITDEDMPGMRGTELVRGIKAQVPEIPIWMSSARTEEEFKQSALGAGAILMAKPLITQELIDAIAPILVGLREELDKSI